MSAKAVLLPDQFDGDVVLLIMSHLLIMVTDGHLLCDVR